MTSQSTDTSQPGHAGAPAQIAFARVKNVKRLGVADVYNMEVEGTHCFAVNGGLIVHNCVDSLRYAIEGVRRTAPVAKSRPMSWG